MSVTERQRGLGRGLSALLGEPVAEAAPVDGAPALAGVRMAPVEQVRPNPEQPRRLFHKAELEELSASIRDRGVLQPILVRPDPSEPGMWQIIAGERRWRAAQMARLTEVPIIERAMDDAEVLEVAIIENVQRSDLNPLEEANAYALLISRFGHTQDVIAGLVGKSRSHVANTLRLVQLKGVVVDLVATGRLSAGHARALLTARDPEGLAQQIVAQGLNVRQTEALARRSQQTPKPAGGKGAAAAEPDTAALEQDLADALGVKVRLSDRNGRGELTLAYANLEQLDDLCRRLMRG